MTVARSWPQLHCAMRVWMRAGCTGAQGLQTASFNLAVLKDVLGVVAVTFTGVGLQSGRLDESQVGTGITVLVLVVLGVVAVTFAGHGLLSGKLDDSHAGSEITVFVLAVLGVEVETTLVGDHDLQSDRLDESQVGSGITGWVVVSSAVVGLAAEVTFAGVGLLSGKLDDSQAGSEITVVHMSF